MGPRPPPSGLKNAATPSIKVLHDMRGRTGAKRNMSTTKDATRSLNFWRAPRMMVLAPPSSRHILKPATVERRQIPPGEARRSLAPTVFLRLNGNEIVVGDRNESRRPMACHILGLGQTRCHYLRMQQWVLVPSRPCLPLPYFFVGYQDVISPTLR